MCVCVCERERESLSECEIVYVRVHVREAVCVADTHFSKLLSDIIVIIALGSISTVSCLSRIKVIITSQSFESTVIQVARCLLTIKISVQN